MRQTGSATPLINLSFVLAVLKIRLEEIRVMLRLLRRAYSSKTVFWEIRLVNLSALTILYFLKLVLGQYVTFVLSLMSCKGISAVNSYR